MNSPDFSKLDATPFEKPPRTGRVLPVAESTFVVNWLFGAVQLLHVVANGAARFLVPWVPLLLVYAASAFRPRELPALLPGRARCRDRLRLA